MTGEESLNLGLSSWRQGDCALGPHWFVFRLDPSQPLTAAGRTAADEGIDLAEEEVAGVVVVTQTCDIVRAPAERPFVEISPLIHVDHDELHAVSRGRLAAHAYLPRLAPMNLVADLDRVMTVEKPVMESWARTPGFDSDAEARAFAAALARKRARFAFPDDFNRLCAKLRSRLIDKHDRESDQGRALRALREIRVQASPSWDAPEVELWFWFVRADPEPPSATHDWLSLCKTWLALVPPSGRFTSVEGQVVTLEDLSAREYVDSDPLDLDHLSSARDSRGLHEAQGSGAR